MMLGELSAPEYRCLSWQLGQWIFGASLILLLVSLGLSLHEIQVSIDALTLQIADVEEVPQRSKQHEAACTAAGHAAGERLRIVERHWLRLLAPAVPLPMYIGPSIAIVVVGTAGWASWRRGVRGRHTLARRGPRPVVVRPDRWRVGGRRVAGRTHEHTRARGDPVRASRQWVKRICLVAER